VKDRTEPRAEFTEQITTRIDALLREFQEMELEQMRKGEIEARAKLAEVKKTFNRKRDAMKKQLEQAGNASSAAWDDARKGVESAWDELRAAMDHARSEFSDAEETETQAV